jgi:hypothetical protein
MKLVRVSHIEFKRNLRFMGYVKKSIYDVTQSKVFYEFYAILRFELLYSSHRQKDMNST